MRSPLLWLIQKELVIQGRSRRIWAETVQLGLLTGFLFGLQLRLPGEYQREVGATLLWFAVLFAGMPTLERSFAADREDGFLDGLRLGGVPTSALFYSKLAVNALVFGLLGGLLAVLWVVLLDLPLMARPVALLAVSVPAILGIAAVGTLLGAVFGGRGERTGSLTILILPLVLPVVLAASEGTRLTMEGNLGGELARWVLFLATFAVVFGVAGGALFEYAVKE